MDWIAIVRLLLGIVNTVVQRLDDAKQQEIGKDAVVKEQLESLVEHLSLAKTIDDRVDRMSDTDVDHVLRNDYRD